MKTYALVEFDPSAIRGEIATNLTQLAVDRFGFPAQEAVKALGNLYEVWYVLPKMRMAFIEAVSNLQANETIQVGSYVTTCYHQFRGVVVEMLTLSQVVSLEAHNTQIPTENLVPQFIYVQ